MDRWGHGQRQEPSIPWRVNYVSVGEYDSILNEADHPAKKGGTTRDSRPLSFLEDEFFYFFAATFYFHGQMI